MQADSANVSGFRKLMRTPLTICGFTLQFAESAYNLRIPPTVAVSATFKLTNNIYHYLLMDPTNWFQIPYIL